MVGGVLYEHGHRMVATLVGAMTVVLALWLQRAEARGWLRRLGWIAAGLVVVQGVLGGVTVLLQLPVLTSAAHACLAQAFFLVIVFIALALSPGWRRSGGGPAAPAGVATAAAFATTAVYVQLVLGAVTRHLHAGLAIPDFPLAFGGLVPPRFTPEIAVHWAHRWGAVVVAVAVAVAALRVREAGCGPALRRPAAWAAALVVIQVALGASIIWTRRHPAVATAHVVTGALLLAACFVTAVRSRRAAAPARRTAPAEKPLRLGESVA
jgi:cytochrome c oxidase assembly protein subunit 15